MTFFVEIIMIACCVIIANKNRLKANRIETGDYSVPMIM